MEEGIGGDIWKRQTRHHRSEERDGPTESDGAKTNGSDSLAHFDWRKMIHQASIN